MYIKKSVLVICAIVLMIVTVFGTVMFVNPFGPLKFNDFFKFKLGIGVLNQFYYENIDTSKMVDGAVAI